METDRGSGYSLSILGTGAGQRQHITGRRRLSSTGTPPAAQSGRACGKKRLRASTTEDATSKMPLWVLRKGLPDCCSASNCHGTPCHAARRHAMPRHTKQRRCCPK